MRGLAWLLLVAACQGQGREQASGSGSAVAPSLDAGGFGGAGSAVGSAVPDEPDEGAPRVPLDAPNKPEEQEKPDPGKVIDDLGAISAWQAVIDRSQFLARRGATAVVFGRVGTAVMEPAPPDPTVVVRPGAKVEPTLVPTAYVWIVDDTEGNGALGIRALLSPRASVKEGDRIALRGAWALDEKRRWYWRADAVEPVPPPPPATGVAAEDPPPAAPGHAILAAPLPRGARTISVARDNDLVYFQIVGAPPAIEGDGWLVADQLGNTPIALLALPGERPSYGGQDMRSTDERWQLRRGKTYWLRIGKIRKRGDKPALINARTAPVLMQ